MTQPVTSGGTAGQSGCRAEKENDDAENRGSRPAQNHAMCHALAAIILIKPFNVVVAQTPRTTSRRIIPARQLPFAFFQV